MTSRAEQNIANKQIMPVIGNDPERLDALHSTATYTACLSHATVLLIIACQVGTTRHLTSEALGSMCYNGWMKMNVVV